MIFDWNYFWGALPELLQGLRMTLTVSAFAIVFSLVLGLVGATARIKGGYFLSALTLSYVEFMRNTPTLVQIFFIFYGFPAIGIRLSDFWSGVLALTLWAGAFHVESFRAGFAAMSPGLKDAASALSLRPWHYLTFIICPVALRAALPSMMNTIVATLKNSSYLQAIGVVEMTFIAVDKVAYEFRTLELFLGLGIIYVACVLVLSFLGQLLERRLDRPYAGR